MIAAGEALPAVAAQRAGFAVERIDDLGRIFVGAGDEHEFAAGGDEAARAFGQVGVVVLDVVVERETARFDAVGRQQRRLRQQQFDHGGDGLLVGQRIAAAGGEHRIEHQRDVGIVGEDFGDDGNDFGAAEQAELEGRHRHVFEQGARLVGDPVGVDVQDVLDPARVLDGQGRDDGERMAAHARQRQQVGLEAGAAGGVGSGEGQDDGRRQFGSGRGHEEAPSRALR